MTTAHLSKLPNGPGPLFCHYPGQDQPQPCHLAIDLETGEVSCDYNPEIGGGIPARVYHAQILWFTIPNLSGPHANQLLDEALPYAQRILDDAEIVWNGNNHVGRLGAAGETAREELEEHIADQYPDARELTVEGFDAESWFTDDEEDAEILGITDNAGGDDVAAAATRLEKLILENVDGPTVVTGAEKAVEDLRDRLRDAVREELEKAAATLDEARTRRNALIRRIYGWNDKEDSLRTIADLADLSHTRVDRIIKESD